jgi:Uma2 family endonuclease
VNVVQPDVAVMSETAPLGPDSGEIPVPLLVVEVLSPSTSRRDRRQKPPLYFRAGVREVWVVDPDRHSVEILTPEGLRARPPGELPRSEVVPGFTVDPAALFEE